MAAYPPAVSDHASPLQHQIMNRTRDLDWTLAHFSFVANVTTLASECDIAHSPAMSVASCRSIPQMALAFEGDSADLLANYADFLAEPGSEVALMVNVEQRSVVEQAFDVRTEIPFWQYVYTGDGGELPDSDVNALVDNDFTAIQDLAADEGFDVQLLDEDPLHYGPAFGIWERRRLVSMGMTIIEIPGAVQIGNVLTRTPYRRKQYASAVVIALLQAHLARGLAVFTLVEKNNQPAIAMLEKLGFVCARPMYMMHCVIRDPGIEGDA